MVQLGILLALGSAFVANLGLLCKYRGAVAAPAVELSHPLRSATGLFRSRWWLIGFGVATVGWSLHVAALSVAPLSLVETTLSGGILLLAWIAERWFGVKVGPRERLSGPASARSSSRPCPPQSPRSSAAPRQCSPAAPALGKPPAANASCPAPSATTPWA